MVVFKSQNTFSIPTQFILPIKEKESTTLHKTSAIGSRTFEKKHIQKQITPCLHHSHVGFLPCVSTIGPR